MGIKIEQGTKVWLTSDLHFGHNKDFVVSARGFNTVEAMNEAIVKNWNAKIAPYDEVYLLGDIMLNDTASGIQLLKSLNGRIHIILGNHDTDTRVALYKQCENVVEAELYATVIHYRKYHLYLSHYPTLTSNFDDRGLRHCTCNLFGHTHQIENFFENNPCMYHVGVDSHCCEPILLDDILEEMENKFTEIRQENQNNQISIFEEVDE